MYTDIITDIIVDEAFKPKRPHGFGWSVARVPLEFGGLLHFNFEYIMQTE